MQATKTSNTTQKDLTNPAVFGLKYNNNCQYALITPSTSKKDDPVTVTTIEFFKRLDTVFKGILDDHFD
ncbi:MAG: hypothetical protein Hyperionvirus9_51 [Hyperionvirus sp.]|uniref:Uncharacterized protein n=1 Tax=Hyperionvirus sp. TaxID=2487770 RepID=A0A3G5AAP3_9VIRU|nr:MAG: hypothetical protein Hyperionvirus9_51 [Hyperionvirus sp.]